MPDLIKRSYLERTDFGSFGWLNKVPGKLWEVPWFSGTLAQSRLRRAIGRANREAVYYQDQPLVNGWIAHALGLTAAAFDPADGFAAILSQAASYRSRGPERIGPNHLEWVQEGWKAKVPESLLEVYDLFAAWNSQSKSYKSGDVVNKNAVFYQDRPSDGGWIAKAAGLLAPYDPADGYAAYTALLISFRMLEGQKLDYGNHLTQPEFSWLKEPLALADIEITVMTAAFASASPAATVTSSAPGASFTSKSPGATFSVN